MISGQQAFFFLATWWAGYFFPSKCSTGYFFPLHFSAGFFFTVIKWGWEACTTPTSRFRTLRLTCLGLSTNFASCMFVVGLVRRISKWLLN